MKKFSRLLFLWAVLWLLACLPLFTLAAADPGQLQIGGQTIDKISIAGDNDGITIANNSYKITVKDENGTGCNSSKYVGKESELTFTNNYNGWVKIYYSITGSGSTGGSGTVNPGTNCTVSDGVITLNAKGSTFTIVVKSSTNENVSSQGSYTAEFKPTAIEYEPLTPEISFVAPSANGSFTVTDADGNAVTLGNTAKSSSYTLTASPNTGYEVYRWVFTNSSGVVSYFGEKTNPATYQASEAGTITCQFMPTGAAKYSVGGAEYIFLDEAVAAAESGSDKKIVLTANGSVYGSTGQTEFIIPNGVTLVLPYASGATEVKGTTISSTSYFPYGNYTQNCANNNYVTQLKHHLQ